MSRRNRTNSTFDDSLFRNDRTYLYYVDRLTELARSMFDWKDVPDTVNIRFLESVLFSEGRAVFFKDEELGFLGLKVANNGMLDVYRDPTVFRAYGDNGYQKELSQKDGVIIYNNLLRLPCIQQVKMFARRLYNFDRIIDVNANAQKTPVLIQCDEEQRMTLMNAYKEFDGNSPVIYGTKNLDMKGSLVAVSTGAPYIADRIQTLKTQTWNEAMSYLGIENVSGQKKERMITSEARQGMGATIASRYSRLEARRTACDQINKMFGLNMSVDYREDYRDLEHGVSPSEDEDSQVEGGELNE